tara:strand:- start:3612 stop:4094 length:483 start_codon:yes stop_codon:yes gene_type:complete
MKSVYGRDSATRYAPGDKKADLNQLIAEYARQQNQRIPSASSSFNAGKIIPRGGYGSKGPLTSGDANIWGNDLLASTLGSSLDRQEFEDGLAMTKFLNENEIAAMKKQFETNKAYQESLQPKQSSGGGFLSKLIGGAKIAVGLGTGNYGLAISGGADLVS